MRAVVIVLTILAGLLTLEALSIADPALPIEGSRGSPIVETRIVARHLFAPVFAVVTETRSTRRRPRSPGATPGRRPCWR